MDWTPEKIAEVLNRLPMVEWDRGIRALGSSGEPDDVSVIVYGWITRDDGHFDFVEITFVGWSDKVGYTTSSARYSKAISLLLDGPHAAYFPCMRIADIPDLAGLVDRLVPWTAATDQ